MEQSGIVRVGGLEVDLRCVPVAVVRYHDGQSGADFVRMTEIMAKLAEERRFIGMLHDTTRLTRVVGPIDRKLMRDATERLTPVMDRKAVGSAVIIRSSIVRGAMTAASWFTSRKFPEKVFATSREGAEWLIARFRDEGEPLQTETAARLLDIVGE